MRIISITLQSNDFRRYKIIKKAALLLLIQIIKKKITRILESRDILHNKNEKY